MVTTLAIIGAGPKALAICTKVRVLHELGWRNLPKLVVIEQDRVASHWVGKEGYTDGLQALGTPPEKDVGFPYASVVWGPGLTNRKMHEKLNKQVDLNMLRYSWQRFLIDTGRAFDEEDPAVKNPYADWIDKGRHAPTHGRWAAYLQWVAKEIGLTKPPGRGEAPINYLSGALRGIDVVHDKWQLEVATHVSGQDRLRCDGIVITGPGSAPHLPGQPPEEHARIYNGRTFWQRKIPFAKDDYVAIIGAGETAAAIAIQLIDEVPRGTIEIINHYGVLLSRGESYTENRLFTDPAWWPNRTLSHRHELIRRGDRGVFSLAAQEALNLAKNITVQAGHAAFDGSIGTAGREITLTITLRNSNDDEVTESRRYDRVIVAVGFEPLSILRTCMTDESAQRLFATVDVNSWDDLTSGLQNLQERIGHHLEVEDLHPGLHLPMIAAVSQGPGFPNLSCLSLTADRILTKYMNPVVSTPSGQT